jgi:hypothetical protein
MVLAIASDERMHQERHRSGCRSDQPEAVQRLGIATRLWPNFRVVLTIRSI